MEEDFDPYHQWLGIPPQQQPPDHYRLLGIEPFEDDPNVIRSAAEQRSVFLHTFQLSRYVGLSERLLNEIASARACLLNTDRKAEYDDQLRQQTEPVETVPEPPVGEPPPLPAPAVPPPAPPEAPPVAPEAPPVATAVPSREYGPWHFALAGIAASVLVLLGLWATGLIRLTGGPGDGRDAPAAEEPEPPVAPRPPVAAPAPGPLRLPAIEDQVAMVGRPLRLSAAAIDSDGRPETIRYELLGQVPEGASLDARTGQFSWTPTDAQAGSAYPIALRAAAPGSNAEAAEGRFQIAVKAANRPPRIEPVEDAVVEPGEELAFDVRAADPDGDTTALRYSLIDPAAGAAITPGGRFAWTPPPERAGQQVRFTVEVREAGSQGLSDQQTFAVSVIRPKVEIAAHDPAVLLGHTGPVEAVAFDPGGERLASASQDGTVKLWDLGGNAPPRTLKGHVGDVYCVAFSPDGARLASGGSDKTVCLWTVASGQKDRLQGHSEGIRSVRFSPDGAALLSAGWDGTVRLWDVAKAAPRRTLSTAKYHATPAAFSPDGRLVASALKDNTPVVWDVETGDQKGRFPAQEMPIWAVALGPRGRLLATGDESGVIRLWDVARGRLLRAMRGHKGRVFSVGFGVEGRMLVSGSRDGTVRAWHVPSGLEMGVVDAESGYVLSVALSPDGRLLAAGCQKSLIKLWDLAPPRRGASTFSVE